MTTIFPLLDGLLYDPDEHIKDRAIKVLTDIRCIVQQKENDYIMNLTLKLAHDDDDLNRVSALKIMNELAPDMGQVLCESFIVPELRSLSIDEKIGVRYAVVKNFINASKVISVIAFCSSLFPMYERLTKDPDEKVRKACADVIAQVAKNSPLNDLGPALLETYYRFLKDATSKLVRGTAFQNIGPFIANFKDQSVIIDMRIVDFFLGTVSGTSSRDVCYFAAYNIPAIFYVLGAECWPKVKPVYLKLTRFNDVKIQKTLAASIHEIAKILGRDVSEEDLSPVLEIFLNDTSLYKEVKTAALKNLNVFLEQISRHKRERFLKYILVQDEAIGELSGGGQSGLDWRMKLLIA